MVPSDRKSYDRRARRWAAASQLSVFGLQVILPIVIRFGPGRRDAFVRGWAAEALSFQIIWIGLFVALTMATAATQLNALGWADVALFEVLGIYGAVCGLIGASRAWRGEVWRYPVNVRLIPG